MPKKSIEFLLLVKGAKRVLAMSVVFAPISMSCFAHESGVCSVYFPCSVSSVAHFHVD